LLTATVILSLVYVSSGRRGGIRTPIPRIWSPVL
jgi:hypothetical protein